MEHLPTPMHSLHRGSKTVPYVCKKFYDGGPFLTYPIREGKPHVLPATSITPGQLPCWQYEKLHPTPKEELESFFQTWLFFGLIHEMLGDLCNPDDFIVTSNSLTDKVVSTSKLVAVVETWVRQVEEGQIITTYEHVAECLQLAYATLRAAGPPFDHQIKLSIASTGEVLVYAANKAFHIEDMTKDNKCPTSWRMLIDDAPWTDVMRVAGWCPSQITLLIQGALSVQSLYFFTALSQPDLPGRHHLCNERKCIAYQTNLEKYTTQHCTNDCQCEELSVDVEVIDQILIEGNLPLMRIIPGQTYAELRLEMVPSRPDSRYVALSHVWADGLGNPTANALPRCQLLRLHGLLPKSATLPDSRGSKDELLLWCDTICCPVEPDEAKKRALLQLKRTYQDATHVLVLDSSLQFLDSNAISPEETCARILSSGWMRRLWTLQEGAIPANNKRLWFQFRDRAVNLHPLLQSMYQMFSSNITHSGLASEIISRIKPFMTFFPITPGDSEAALSVIEKALRDRSVSVSTDEPLLIGNLLALNVEKILDGPAESRVHRMWSLMPSARRGIPKDILFRLGPRLKEEGFRWAPSTMLDIHERRLSELQSKRDGDNQGIPTPRGLLVSLCGYKLRFPPRPKGLPANPWNIVKDKNLVYMREEDGVWYIIHRRVSSASSSGGDFLSDDSLCDIVHRDEELRIVHLESDFQPRADGIYRTSTSLLVKVLQEENDVTYVQPYMHVNVTPLQGSVLDMFEAAYHSAKQLMNSVTARALADLGDGDVDLDLPAYKTLFDGLEPEIRHIARMEENEAALAAARQMTGKDDVVLFEAIIKLLFIGHFAYMGTRNSVTQRWCVS